MKRTFIISILSLLLFNSCEKDDFCIDPVTPKMILRFYNATNNTNLKSVSELYVWAEGRDSIFKGETLDSIYIPLDVTKSQIVYNFSRGTTQDQLIISYDVEEEYVSRSCGFRAIFNNVTIQTSNNWIESLNPETIPTINNETSAHVQVFH